MYQIYQTDPTGTDKRTGYLLQKRNGLWCTYSIVAMRSQSANPAINAFEFNPHNVLQNYIFLKDFVNVLVVFRNIILDASSHPGTNINLNDGTEIKRPFNS